MLEQLNTPPDAADYLSRTYWCNRVLGSIERIAALKEWGKVADDDDYPMERALGAIDLFIAEKPVETLEELSEHLDRIAASLQVEHQDLEYMTARQKACTLAAFLRSHNLVGVAEEDYRNLQNNLMSIALCDAGHPSLPLISAAIFCSVARRLGLHASLCNFPLHIVCQVSAADDRSLDHRPTSDSAPQGIPLAQRVMFMDPFRTSEEVSRTSLESQLDLTGVPRNQHESCLTTMSTKALLVRTSRKIVLSLRELNNGARLQRVLTSPTRSLLPPSVDPVSPTHLDCTTAMYFIMILNLIFVRDGLLEGFDVVANMSSLIRSMRHYTTDGALMNEYFLPLALRNEGPNHAARYLVSTLRTVGDEETAVPLPKRRNEGSLVGATRVSVYSAGNPPAYCVGDLFVHRRYGYQGAITGWDVRCEAGERWVLRMGVDQLPNGRNQSFYNVLVDDESERYVAEENIMVRGRHAYRWRGGENVSKVVPDERLMRVAGRYFKRWDEDNERFVSNVRDVYPDD